jgi:hypothetical protein
MLCIRQRAMAQGVLERLEARLRQSVESEFGVEQREAEWAAAEELRKVQHQLARAARDLALAEPDPE